MKILLFSHSGFSDENANGITMKNLLSAWDASDVAQFYCDGQKPDFTAAHSFFRITDIQAIQACFGKRTRRIFYYEGNPGEGGEEKGRSKGSGNWRKKYKYQFLLRWLREAIWMLSPWGHRQLEAWADAFSPDVLLYMVGESIFLDKLVLKFCERTGKPLVLYNGEAYRIIQLEARHGLERLYYQKLQKLYRKLLGKASLVIYNCETLREGYEKTYPKTCGAILAYNTAEPMELPYVPQNPVHLTYFGNLGVGRSDVLLQVGEILKRVDPGLRLAIYGNAQEEYIQKFAKAGNMDYQGFVDGKTLRKVIAHSDILLHVESFDPQIAHKLRYAFSTKIAQCMCAGRCFLSFAPKETASSKYLAAVGGGKLVSDAGELYWVLKALVGDPALRKAYAEEAFRVGMEHHRKEAVSSRVKAEIEKL